jgi:hypothetical protein
VFCLLSRCRVAMIGAYGTDWDGGLRRLTDWISLGVQIKALTGQLTELRAQVAGLAQVRQDPENSSRPPHRTSRASPA